MTGQGNLPFFFFYTINKKKYELCINIRIRIRMPQ